MANFTALMVNLTVPKINASIPELQVNFNRTMLQAPVTQNMSSLTRSYTVSSTVNGSFNTKTVTTAHATDSIKWSVEDSPYTSFEIMLTFLFVLIFLVGTIGNGSVFYYFGMKKKARRSIPELLFSYLAVVDFVASVINPTVFTYFTLNRYNWGASEFMCRFTLSLGAIFTTMSGAIFIIIALDRERTIVFPFKSHFKRSTMRWCVVVAIFYSVSMNFHYALRLHLNQGRCLIDDVTKLSYWFPTLVCFLIHDLTLIFVFTFTNLRIVRHIRSNGTASILGALWEKRKRDNAKVIRLLVVLATMYFVLTLPRDIFQMVYSLSWVAKRGIPFSPTIFYVNSCVKSLSASNSCVNFFIYYRMHRGFRKQIQKQFCCICSGGSYSETSTLATESSPMLTQRNISEAELDRRHINDAVGRKRSNRLPRSAGTDSEKMPMAQSLLVCNEEKQSIDDGVATEKRKFVITRMQSLRRHSDTESEE